jgi:hypothetical protein
MVLVGWQILNSQPPLQGYSLQTVIVKLPRKKVPFFADFSA